MTRVHYEFSTKETDCKLQLDTLFKTLAKEMSRLILCVSMQISFLKDQSRELITVEQAPVSLSSANPSIDAQFSSTMLIRFWAVLLYFST